MLKLRNSYISFFHGIATYSVFALAPIIHSKVPLGISLAISLYAGWYPRASLAAFLGGVAAAVIGWLVSGSLSYPKTAMAALFMGPLALLVLLFVAFVLYIFGKILYKITHYKE